MLLLAALFVFGVAPRLLTDRITPAVTEVVAQAGASPVVLEQRPQLIPGLGVTRPELPILAGGPSE